MKYYHLSKKYLGDVVTLKAKIPNSSLISKEGNIPRVCFGTSIPKCVRSICGHCDTLTFNDIIDFKGQNKYNNIDITDLGSKNFSINMYKQYIAVIKKSGKQDNKKITAINSFKYQIKLLKKLGLSDNTILTDELIATIVGDPIYVNPSVYIPINNSKIYLPPNAVDFRKNEEYWAVSNCKVEFIGFLDLLQFFTKQEIVLTKDSNTLHYEFVKDYKGINNKLYLRNFKTIGDLR